MKRVISTTPKTNLPYSQAVVLNGMAYLSGQIALDPATNQVVEGGIERQTEQVLENLQVVLKACGASFASVVKTTVFLKDMAEFSKMNEVYARYFPENPPARSTIQAAALPRGVDVEIDAIAAVE